MHTQQTDHARPRSRVSARVRTPLRTPALVALAAAAAAAQGQCPDYRLDDGSGTLAVGPAGFDAQVTWMNAFEARDGCVWIDEVLVSFSGSLPAGTPITLVIYDDPTDDGDPTDAVPLSLASRQSEATSVDELARYAIRPTPVTGGFFVACSAYVPDRQTVARLDTDSPGLSSWLLFSDDLPLDPGAAPFIQRMDEGIRGAWMVRAVAATTGCAADLDGDGAATLLDFLAFQNAFDAGDLLADFDADGTLTLLDFLAFQNAFDAGC